MSYRLRFTRQAEDDLSRLFDFLLERDVSAAAQAEAALYQGMAALEIFPFSCRKADDESGNPFLRELIIPFGRAGYVVLFEIEDHETVTILAVRRQREDDYL